MNANPKKDLRDALTVFVSTVGYPTFETCLERLREQDCEFTLKIIDRVAPMSAALQRMIDDCATPYFVQVDEDMLIYPHGVRTLYERLAEMDPKVVQYVAALYDVHLERVIYGLKIFKHEIVRRYPYRDVMGCEWEQIGRFRRDGYIDVRVPIDGATQHSDNTLGLHGTHWTPEAVYLRYYVLELTRRKGNKTHAWVAGAAESFLQRFLEKRSEVDFYALMGILSGSLADDRTTGREKDYRTYNQTPGFERVRGFLEEANESWGARHEHGPPAQASSAS